VRVIRRKYNHVTSPQKKYSNKWFSSIFIRKVDMKKIIKRRNKYGQMIVIGHILTKQNLKLQGDDGLVLILNIRNPKAFLDGKGPDTFIFEPDRETERFVLNTDNMLVSDGPKALIAIYNKIMLLEKVYPDEFINLIHKKFFFQVW
jgi:hypothetical protein